MKDEDPANSSAYKMLSRMAFYCVIFAWIILGIYIFFEYANFNKGIIEYFLSTEQSAIKFRALILLAPFVLTAVGYLVNEKAKLLKKTLSAEKELRQRTIELEKVNELLTKENIERRKAEELLTNHAFYDSLTNLPNRSLFMDRLHNSMERRKRYKDHTFAVLFLDVDRFKIVNDSLGHVIGDHLLIMISQRLKKHMRSIDTIARFGGDEFAILMEDTKGNGHANDLADRIHKEMSLPFSVFGHEIFATVSIGIVLSNLSDYSRPEELLRDADTAMYNAKARGKACHVIFDSTMHAEAATLLQLETDLRKAVEHNEFILYYQPILLLENKRIIGFEALIRWRHPSRGLITPAEFILVAEETGLILTMSKWIIREACRQMHSWQEQFPEYRNLAISVNVSSKVFSQLDFYEMIEKILQETGLEGSCLKLEIVESMLIENPEPAAALIKRLKNLNVRFDIDDFGTGYSALNYLRHFPINGLKIDGSFINALTSDKNNAEIVKTIISLGQALNLEVVAECIETPEQLEQFMGMHGKYAQGFFLFRPMDSKSVENLLREKNI
jgi:diguanylate cyclase (GGDEF)-like protein